MLRIDPMNLLGIMPAKEGRKKVKRKKAKKDPGIPYFLLLTFYLLLVKHSFAGVLFICCK